MCVLSFLTARKSRFQNDLLCVAWNVKHYSLSVPDCEWKVFCIVITLEKNVFLYFVPQQQQIVITR